MAISQQLPLVARVVRPYISRELPGWGKLYELTGLADLKRLANLPPQVVKGKWHGKWMELNLADWSERFTFFLGRYYDLPTQLMLREYLRKGDCVVDIGANIGMISLFASHLVGPQGAVISFEPNPLCCQRIQSLIQRNGISNVTLLQAALSDRPGTLELKVNPEHTGTATLTPIPTKDQGAYSQRFSVDVKLGDAVLGEGRPIQLIKIDVEGFETNVLRGCRGIMQRWKPAIVTEAVKEHLERAGSSLEDLFSLMQAEGYAGYQLLTEARFTRHVLTLKPVANAAVFKGEDILWLHPESEIASRGLQRGA